MKEKLVSKVQQNAWYMIDSYQQSISCSKENEFQRPSKMPRTCKTVAIRFLVSKEKWVWKAQQNAWYMQDSCHKFIPCLTGNEFGRLSKMPDTCKTVNSSAFLVWKKTSLEGSAKCLIHVRQLSSVHVLLKDNGLYSRTSLQIGLRSTFVKESLAKEILG